MLFFCLFSSTHSCFLHKMVWGTYLLSCFNPHSECPRELRSACHPWLMDGQWMQRCRLMVWICLGDKDLSSFYFTGSQIWNPSLMSCPITVMKGGSLFHTDFCLLYFGLYFLHAVTVSLWADNGHVVGDLFPIPDRHWSSQCLKQKGYDSPLKL